MGWNGTGERHQVGLDVKTWIALFALTFSAVGIIAGLMTAFFATKTEAAMQHASIEAKITSHGTTPSHRVQAEINKAQEQHNQRTERMMDRLTTEQAAMSKNLYKIGERVRARGLVRPSEIDPNFPEE